MFAKLSCFPTEPDLCQKRMCVLYVRRTRCWQEKLLFLYVLPLPPQSHVWRRRKLLKMWLVKLCIILQWAESRNTKTN